MPFKLPQRILKTATCATLATGIAYNLSKQRSAESKGRAHLMPLNAKPLTTDALLPDSIVRVTSPTGGVNYLVGVAPTSKFTSEILHLLTFDCNTVYFSNQASQDHAHNLLATQKILAKSMSNQTNNITKVIADPDFGPLGYILRAIMLQEAVEQTRKTFENADALSTLPRDLSYTISKLSTFDVFLLGFYKAAYFNMSEFEAETFKTAQQRRLQVVVIDDLKTLSDVYEKTGDAVGMLCAKAKSKLTKTYEKIEAQTKAADNNPVDLYADFEKYYNQYKSTSSITFMFAGLAFGLKRPLLTKQQLKEIKELLDSFKNEPIAQQSTKSTAVPHFNSLDDLVIYTEGYPDHFGTYALDFYHNYAQQLFDGVEAQLNKGSCMLVLNCNQLYSAYGMLQIFKDKGYTLEIITPNQVAAPILFDEADIMRPRFRP